MIHWKILLLTRLWGQGHVGVNTSLVSTPKASQCWHGTVWDYDKESLVQNYRTKSIAHPLPTPPIHIRLKQTQAPTTPIYLHHKKRLFNTWKGNICSTNLEIGTSIYRNINANSLMLPITPDIRRNFGLVQVLLMHLLNILRMLLWQKALCRPSPGWQFCNIELDKLLLRQSLSLTAWNP